MSTRITLCLFGSPESSRPEMIQSFLEFYGRSGALSGTEMT